MRLPRAVRPTLVALALLGLGAACSGGSGTEAGTRSLPSDAELRTYFAAVTSYDPDLLGAAEAIAADGSPAQGYAAYLGELSTAAIAAGQPVAAGEVEVVDGGYRACGGTGAADECVTWSDFEGQDGRLTDFTVAGAKLDDVLVDLTAQTPVESPGLYSMQPEYAYRSPQSGTLYVLVSVSAGDGPVAPRPGIYIEQDAILDGVETASPASIDAGTTSPVALAFPDAEKTALDGQVTFELGLGDRAPESIGFGLTAAAP